MQNDLNKPLHLHISVGAIVGVAAEASPHKRRLKCDTNISPKRLITHLLHQIIHHRTTLRGNGQWSATIAKITTKTHTTTLTTKRSSESCAIRSFCGWPYPHARLGVGRNPYSTSSETKSSSLKLGKGWVQTHSASPSTPTEGYKQNIMHKINQG